jgi:magnesium chelatase subunit I
MAITDQEAWGERDTALIVLPDYLREAVERIAGEARQSEYVDQSSGVSARLSISALECVISNVERRGLMTGENRVVARVSDLVAAIPAVTGKVELVYEGEQEGPLKVARFLIGRAVKQVFEDRFPPVHPRRNRRREEGPAPTETTSPYRDVMGWFSGGRRLTLDDRMNAEEHLAALTVVPGLADLARKHLAVSEGAELGAAMEFVLEGMHQSSVLAREDLEGRKTYQDMLQTMFSSLEES